MKIFNLPPSQGDYSFRFNEEEAIVNISRNADSVIKNIDKIKSYLTKNEPSKINQSKFHNLVTDLVQGFSEFQASIHDLVAENPKYTEHFVESKEVYNLLVQPFVVSNFNHSPTGEDFSEIIDNLERAKESISDIIDHF